MHRIVLIVIALVFSNFVVAQKGDFEIATLKYSGGGDWYANPTALPNLIAFCNKNLDMSIHPEPATVEVSGPDIFNYPFIYMTGHGNVVFSQADRDNLRAYLLGGGFLHIDDNYGMDQFIRPQLEQLFPELELVELPFDHPIYHQTYSFPNGLPKVHEHDDQPPQGFGLIYEDRLILFYTYETDLGNGWEDQEIHNNSDEIREKAFRMGANILQYVLMDGSL